MLYRSGLRYALLSRETQFPLPWVGVYPSDNSECWRVLLQGPAETPYAEAFFELVIDFPQSYPFEPPSVRFLTPPLHVNISRDGRICDLILSRRKYSVSTSMVDIIFRIYQLLHSPNQLEPLNTEVAQLRIDLQREAGKFEEEVRKHAVKTAFRSPEQFHTARGVQAPSAYEMQLRCPFSHQLLFDPVVAPAGHVCERQALLWAIESNSSSAAALLLASGPKLKMHSADFLCDFRDCPAVKDKAAAWRRKRCGLAAACG
ncbi:unnamed protein product [Polarella glacialis]|uniref:UBC core domain-containing protein n=1 Tax=Polarella glacialis TaxID=89957 RepID=A0A813HFU9_POLGL|nr:unnamed protein product [Polarella glacialis]